MYRIGEFSEKNKVSIKTLRYYDEIGLFKPQIIDKLTGYRYYDESQEKVFTYIVMLKDMGFSLEEIKNIINNENKEKIIEDKVDNLINQNKLNDSKIRMLNRMVKTNKEVEFRAYQEKYIICKKVTLESRNDLDKELDKIKEVLKSNDIGIERSVLWNLELGYEEENIDAFIGFELSANKKIKLDGFEVFGASKVEKMLIGRGKKSNIKEIYQKMIDYSEKNNIQIRGFFCEVYDGEDVTIYAEAFDLNKENPDEIMFLKSYNDNKKYNKPLDEDLIGTYTIREILPWYRMANPNKQKSKLDTKYQVLELKADGTTNYENIKWNERELYIYYDNIYIPFRIHKETYEGKKYIIILMNESLEYYKSQRPLEYIYEKK